MRKNPEDVAEALEQIYESAFGGKKRGRYQISRPRLRALSQRGRLEDTIVHQIKAAAFERGLEMIDVGDDFAVIGVHVMRNYRKVPQRLIRELSGASS